jgi:hypothetical protein
MRFSILQKMWQVRSNTMSQKDLHNIIQKTKEDAEEWLRNLSMAKDVYVDEYRQRIMELNAMGSC